MFAFKYNNKAKNLETILIMNCAVANIESS